MTATTSVRWREPLLVGDEALSNLDFDVVAQFRDELGIELRWINSPAEWVVGFVLFHVPDGELAYLRIVREQGEWLVDAVASEYAITSAGLDGAREDVIRFREKLAKQIPPGNRFRADSIHLPSAAVQSVRGVGGGSTPMTGPDRRHTRGIVYVHSSPRALSPHIEWALGSVLGISNLVLEWIDQPLSRGDFRSMYPWHGPDGTAARIASALKGWQRIRFEVTEEVVGNLQSERYSYTPTLGVFHSTIGLDGQMLFPESAIRAVAKASSAGAENHVLNRMLTDLLGTAWDEELERFRMTWDDVRVEMRHNPA